MTEEQEPIKGTSSGHTLGEMLKAARTSRGLELSELSRQTAVRADYLAALEEDRLHDLPEPVYVRNFVKLFAQAVGLDARKALEMYAADMNREGGAGEPAAAVAAPAGRRRPERPAAAAAGTAGTGAAAPRPPAVRPQTGTAARPSAGRPKDQPRFRGFGTWLPSLLLIVVVVGLAVWGFNSTLFQPARTPAGDSDPVASDAPQAGGLAAPATEDADEVPAGANTVRLTVTTEPAGARVLVDAFPIEGLTPIAGAPVTARESRLIRVELDGYEPFEAPFDLTFDRNLSFVLQEATEAPAVADVNQPADQPAASSEGNITVTVSDESWLEIYPGTAREGTPHVYTTASPGQTYSFDLPVYIRVGNAAGISVSVNGRDLGPLGSAGEITGRAFTSDD